MHSLYNFKWQPVSRGIRFDRLGQKNPASGPGGIGGSNTGAGQAPKNTAVNHVSEMANSTSQNGHSSSLTISDLNSRQIVNHFEFHHLITEKYNLLISLTKFCDL